MRDDPANIRQTWWQFLQGVKNAIRQFWYCDLNAEFMYQKADSSLSPMLFFYDTVSSSDIM